ncbi:LacI family DNA-binding transcriptional regulator [Actinacidiphila glaucinigra]|uniref:LacI family DNA-binding transcriptional regulator n=1 Tax=Actinacidiphila glaucinigra TaxID=235986 RepID=UPI0036A390A5
MRLHVDQRHERVLELVRQRGTLRVSDLADELGVSTVTVRRDVETLAEQGRLRRVHGSVLGPAAGGVREPARTGARDAEGLVVGMVVPTLDYSFGEIVQGAREALEARGGRLVLGLSGYVAEGDEEQAGRLVASGVDGLLLTPGWTPAPGSGTRIAERAVPLVLVERLAPPGSQAAELDRVRTDSAQGAAMAVRHLAALGHGSVALVLQETAHAGQLRSGYAAAVEALGLAPAPGSPYTAPPELPEAERVDVTVRHVRALVEEHGVHAVLMHGDELAVMVVSRLKALGLRVPEDLAVVVYDDQAAGLADPPLTAVAAPKREVGEAAVALLLERVAAGGASSPRRHVDLLPSLRVRSSCGAAYGP